MKLHMCFGGKSHADLPGPMAHPCGKAAKAVDEAGVQERSRAEERRVAPLGGAAA